MQTVWIIFFYLKSKGFYSYHFPGLMHWRLQSLWRYTPLHLQYRSLHRNRPFCNTNNSLLLELAASLDNLLRAKNATQHLKN